MGFFPAVLFVGITLTVLAMGSPVVPTLVIAAAVGASLEITATVRQEAHGILKHVDIAVANQATSIGHLERTLGEVGATLRSINARLGSIESEMDTLRTLETTLNSIARGLDEPSNDDRGVPPSPWER